MAKAMASGLKNWFKATRESTETVAKRVVTGEAKELPIDYAAMNAKILTQMDNPKYLGEAKRFAEEQVRKNPMFKFATEYGKIGETGEQMVNIIESETKKAMKLGKAQINFPENAVNKMKQQAAILGLDPDAVEAAVKDHKFSSARKIFDDAVYERSYRDYATGVKSICEERKISQIEIDKIFKDSNLSWKDKGTRLTAMADSALRISDEALKDAGYKVEVTGLGKWEKYLTGVEAKTGDAIRYFNQKGHVIASKALGRYGDVARIGGVAKSKLQQLRHDIVQIDKGLGTKKAQAIRFYMENRDYKRAVDYAESPVQDLIKANPEILDVVQQKFGVKLGYDDLKYANKKESALREVLRFHSKIKDQAYDEAVEALPRSIREIDGRVISRADEVFGNVGDLGTGYHPRIGNEQWLDSYMKKNPEDMLTYRDSIKNNDTGTQLKFFERARTNSNELTLDENRLMPEEEISRYFSGMADLSIRREGKRAINEAKFATMMPLGDVKTRNLIDEHTYLNALEKQWDINFNPANMQDMNMLEKGLMAYTKMVIPIALTSDKMIVSNSFQAVFTSGFRDGYIRTLAATAKEMSKFAATVLLNPTKINQAFDLMASGDMDKARLKGKVGGLVRGLYRYEKNNVGLHTMVDEDLKGILQATGDGAVSKITRAAKLLGEIISFPFAASDQISRRASFTAAWWHGEEALKKYSKSIKGGMDSIEATGILAKDLHLGSFNLGNDFDYIIKSIDPNDIMRTGDEFLYRYASRSMRQTIFDYSSNAQSLLKGMAKEKSPLLGVALTFTSWPMYFHELAKGAVDAWKMGDRAPLTKLVAGGLATYMASTYIMGEDSKYQKGLKPYMDKKGLLSYGARVASEMPGYLQARAPGTSYLAFVEKVTASPAGILTPAVGVITYPIFKAIEDVSVAMGADEGQGSINFLKNNAKKYYRSEIAYRKTYYMTQVLKEVGIMDKDLKELLEEVSE